MRGILTGFAGLYAVYATIRNWLFLSEHDLLKVTTCAKK